MNRLVFILFLFSFSIIGIKPASSKEYTYCNVFLANLCFGIKDGDSYSARAEVDFTMYTITLRNGDSIQIYEGRHPKLFDYRSAYISKISVNGYSVSAIKTTPFQQRILVEPITKRIPKSDIFVKMHAKDSSITRDFLTNFRSCFRTKLEVECKEEPLLNKLEL